MSESDVYTSKDSPCINRVKELNISTAHQTKKLVINLLDWNIGIDQNCKNISTCN